MSIAEAEKLRKEGRLQEAYREAMGALRIDMCNTEKQASLFRVLCDMCEQFVVTDKTDDFNILLCYLEELLSAISDERHENERLYVRLLAAKKPDGVTVIKAFHLAKDKPAEAFESVRAFIDKPTSIPSSLHESLGWIVFLYLRQSKQQHLSAAAVSQLLHAYLTLQLPLPSLLHSQILNFAIYFTKEHAEFDFYSFFIDWGPQYFRQEDMKRYTLNGKTVHSLISRTFQAIAWCDTVISIDPIYQTIQIDKTNFLDRLSEQYYWRIHRLTAFDKAKAYSVYLKYSNMFSAYESTYWSEKIHSTARALFK